MQYQPRDIYEFVSREDDNEQHPFAILGPYDEYQYLGCMITHGDPKKYVDNVPMQPDYFEKDDIIGNVSTVLFSIKNEIGSHFMRVRLEKHNDLNVKLAGRLSVEGFNQMSAIVQKFAPEKWIVFKKYSDAQVELNHSIRKKRKHEDFLKFRSNPSK
jgi:hypothetical protein